MRITNLMILLAIISGVILVAQYISQLRKSKNGNNFVSGGRVFFNWVLAIVFVICIAGITVNAFHGGHQETKSNETKATDVEYTAPKKVPVAVSVQFDKKVKLNDDGQVKVKFKVSPQTKVTIRGHKSQELVETFKASKGTKYVTHSYIFDYPGTYDIIAERDHKKVVKTLKVKSNNANASSSSQMSTSSSSASSSSSSASTATDFATSSANTTSTNPSLTQGNGNSTGRSTTRSSGNRSQFTNNYGTSHSVSSPSQTHLPSSNVEKNNGQLSDKPLY